MSRHRLFRPADWPKRTILFYIVFQGIHLAIFGYGWYKQQTDERLAVLNKLTYSVWLSRGAALAASLDASLLVLPMCRECLKFLRPKMRWIPLHDSQWFHYQVAYSLLFYTSIHTGSHYVNFFNVAHLKLRPVKSVQIHYTQQGGITGHIMLLCMLLMFTMAHRKIRRQSYEGFWYMHHLFIVFFLALLVHGTGCFVRDTVKKYSPFAGKDFWEHCIGYQSFRWELFPLTIYLAERIYRFYRSRQDAKVLAVFRHGPKLLEVRFEKKGMEYKAGQWLFVKFPDITASQWHPFSISSCPEDPYVSFHIQQTGDFTAKFADAFDVKRGRYRLSQLYSTEVQQLPPEKVQSFPRIRIDGPYGSLAQDVFTHEVSVMVGAGIGVTPWVSILKSIWHLRNNAEASAKSKLKRLEFIWICRETAEYSWLHDVIMNLEKQSKTNDNDRRFPDLRCRIFITRNYDPLSLEKLFFRVLDRQSTIDFNSKTLSTASNVSEILDTTSPSVSPPITPVSPGWPVSPATPTSSGLFRPEMRHGRPNFVHELDSLTRILEEDGFIKSDSHKAKKLQAGVYYCGPDGAGKTLRDACVQASSKKIEYSFWKERGSYG